MNPFSSEPVPYTAEVERIAALPRRTYTPDQIGQIVAYMTARLRTPTGTMTLFSSQAISLWELAHYGGAVGSLPVGIGKELLCFLAPTVLGAKRPLILMPAHLVERSERERRDDYGPHWQISPYLELFSFQKLGLSQYSRKLDDVPPDLIVVNEAHKLKNPRAACTRRFRRFLAKHPDTKVVVVSGTLLSKSLLDFGPLIQATLKDRAPVPRDSGELAVWAAALDEKPGDWQRTPPGALLSFCKPEDLSLDARASARKGFQRRLADTPGVIVIGEADVATPEGDPVSIEVRAVEYDQDPIVETHFERLRKKYETPHGWMFSNAMEVWARARQLALGFHYEWRTRPDGWKSPDDPGPWMSARRTWATYVRETLKHSRTSDSEKQVADACKRSPRPVPAYEEWARVKDTFVPETYATFHCYGAINACVRWAAESRRGVIYTDHWFFARELARLTGLKYYGRKGVDDQGNRIEDADPNSVVVASRFSNSTGRNIQFWDRCLITALPPNALELEQLIGRHHRTGQKSDVVRVDALVGCAEHVEAWHTAIALAKATRDMLGAPQKILVAEEVEPFPEIDELEDRAGWKWDRVSATG